MRQTTRYSILLTAALIAFFLVASMLDSPSGQLIINLVALLPFPLVMYTMLRRLANEDESFTVRGGIGTGEAVARRAAVLFSLFTLLYGQFFIEARQPIWIMAMGGIGTLITTWLIGFVFAALCAWVVARGRAGGKGEAATQGVE